MATPDPNSHKSHGSVLVEQAANLTAACVQWSRSDFEDPARQVAVRDEIAAGARRILLETATPTELMWSQLVNLYALISLRTLSQHGVLQALSSEKGISAEELAEATGMEVSLIRRLLRPLTATQFLSQGVESGLYHHTKASQAFCVAPELHVMLDVLSEHTLLSLGCLPEYLAERKSASEPQDQAYNPYTWSRGQDGTSVWQVMAENGELARFQAGLNPGNKEVFKPTGFFDFGALAEGDDARDRAILVDVGGGIGAILTSIIEETPALQAVASRCVLQDIACPIDQARSGGKLPVGVQTMVHNFFQEQPVKGPKAYYLRRILHDYSDAKCVEILSYLTKSAAADTKILISEVVDPLTNNESDIPMVCTDVIMLNIGGKERSEEQFGEILKAAGLELVKVWRGPSDCLIEARLAVKNNVA
ncbi:hypothetical protein PRZ48_011271 [Zasmidium cellare]|uniref:O-methyltransferase domain-containing protein n=1 Tax=Zasmidium cellare TaxID=395010 RepID=A0ABR0EAX3_ZASCE|nr:hypothetical protein PRZ48_011271 [Zasmidium cellare]